jgi:hypothetical protein
VIASNGGGWYTIPYTREKRIARRTVLFVTVLPGVRCQTADYVMNLRKVNGLAKIFAVIVIILIISSLILSAFPI